MSEKLKKLKEILTCPYCQDIYSCPVILPCGDRICQAHLKINESIVCLVCFEKVDIKSNDLQVDKILTEIVCLNLFSNVITGREHTRALETFNNLEMMICDFEKLIYDPYFYLYETINQIKNEIDLKNEIESLDNYEQLHAELDKFEIERKQKLEDNKQLFIKKYKIFKEKSIDHKLRLERFDENEAYWHDLINKFDRDILTLQYILNDIKNSTLNYKRLRLFDCLGDTYGQQEEYNSFTNVFDIEILATEKYFNLVFGLEENLLNDCDFQTKIFYQNIGVVLPSRPRAQVDFEIGNFSNFIECNRCIYGEKFLFKERMWQISAKYTYNCNLSFHINLCDLDLRENEVFSVKASIKPVEINAGDYSCSDLFEKRLECGDFSAENRSNGFLKYYFSSVDWLTEEKIYRRDRDSIIFQITIVDTDEIHILKEATSILTSLNPYNLNETYSALKTLEINTEDRLKGLVCVVYEYAFIKHNYSRTFSQLCQLLADLQTPSDNNNQLKVDFASLLEKRCYKELVSEYQFSNKIKRIRFFAELFNIGLLGSTAVLKYITSILRNGFEEENISCLSRLLTIIGKKLDATKESSLKLNELIISLEKAIQQANLNSKTLYMILNIVELRANSWSPNPSYNQITERKNELEFYENKLAYIIPKRFSMKFKKNNLFDRIEHEFTDSDFLSEEFMRALTNCICKVCFSSCNLDKNLFEQLDPVLVEFMHREDEFEFIVLSAIDGLENLMQPGFKSKILSLLLDKKIMTIETTKAWEERKIKEIILN